ncbi:MAG: SDR family NAD(P)-dependent oxidoreductase, partial [Actinomycetia bacterium]|nr:SDR family NAD(P)-dependent oxidoreductase [Actinomycetes bacterium]
MSRTSVVVGANRGLGLELTRQLIAQGDQVIATARDVGGATELAALGAAAVLAVDIAHEHSVAAFAEALAAETDAVDLLINNAGINAGAVGYDGPAGILDIPGSTLLEVTQVNAVGPLLT